MIKRILLSLGLLLAVTASHAANLPPTLRQRYFSTNGAPLAGGLLYTYQSGTTTPQATYTDQGGGTPNANPIVLDANGEAAMWLDPSLSYKFVLKNSAGVTQWTTDGVVGLLGNNAVVTASIADSAVTTAKIAALNVTDAKLATGAVTGAAGGGKLAASAISGQTEDTLPDPAADYLLSYDASATALKKALLARAHDLTVASKTTTYTATNTDDVILVSTAGGAWTLSLPAVATSNRKVFKVKKTTADLSALTIDPSGAELIDGAATTKVYTQGESITIVCDGTAWYVVDRIIPAIPTAYTPTYDQLGTTAAKEAFWTRYGGNLFVQGTVTSGTVDSGAVTISLPSGLTIKTQTETSNKAVGNLTLTGQTAPFQILAASGGTVVNYSDSASATAFTADTGTTWSNSTKGTFYFTVPIQEWN